MGLCGRKKYEITQATAGLVDGRVRLCVKIEFERISLVAPLIDVTLREHAAFPNGAHIIYERFVPFHSCIFLCPFLVCCRLTVVFDDDGPARAKKYEITQATTGLVDGRVRPCVKIAFERISLVAPLIDVTLREHAAFPNGARMTYERFVAFYSCIFLCS